MSIRNYPDHILATPPSPPAAARMSSQNMGGHHGIFMVRCSDVLVSEFNIKKRYIHDLTVVSGHEVTTLRYCV
jgi:hypothetical protein